VSLQKEGYSVTHLLLEQMQACVMEGNFSGEMPHRYFLKAYPKMWFYWEDFFIMKGKLLLLYQIIEEFI